MQRYLRKEKKALMKSLENLTSTKKEAARNFLVS